jgi:cytochrome b
VASEREISGGPEPGVDTAVRDGPVRVVHWSIVILVVALVTTGLSGGDAVMQWHMRLGETLLAVVLFRIAWGFAGSRNARFASFLRGPRACFRYLRSILRPPHEVHATYNPVFGWMIVALLLALLVQCCLGLFAHDETLTEGPLVKLITEDLSDTLSWLHRRGWWVVVGLASIHIVAVLAFSLAGEKGLIRSMVSGRKALPLEIADPEAAAASLPRATILLALCALAVWWTVTRP